MEKTITLPVSGATVILRDPKELKQKDREKVWAAISPDDNFLIQGNSTIKGILAIIIKSWTLDLLVPSLAISSLGELDIADYDALLEEATKVQEMLFNSGFADTKKNQDNPDSPLDNSNG
jgi:hypothetical protein